ncbi:hypothetical protein EP331_06240 [bacterium]|nr:MAG: hypothetical protein EP331_06240 [bacterium]
MALAIALGILFGYSSLIIPQDSSPDNQHFVITNWNMANGLPQSSINDIIQTKDGYIWLATFGGLVRFDGVSFTTFDRTNTKGMRSDRINDMYEDKSGYIWLSSENGFLRFKDGECKEFDFKINGVSYSPSFIAEDSRNRLWITLNGTAFYYKDSTFYPAKVLTDSVSKEKAINNKDGLWVNQDLRILRTWGDSVALTLNLSYMLTDYLDDVIEYPKGSGTLFIASSGDGVIRYQNNQIDKFGTKDGLPSRYTWEFYTDNQDQLWVASYNGLSRWNGSSFNIFTEISTNKDLQITDLMQDSQGNYWIGTSSNGLYRLRPSIITTLSTNKGIWNDKMLSLTTLKDGRFLFATNCGGLYEWDGHQAVHSAINDYLPNLCVWSVFQDSKDRIWIGSRLLYMTKDLTKPGVRFDISSDFTGQDIYTISEDKQGNIWIGCYNGVYKYDGKTFTHYSTEQGMSYHDTRVIKQTNDGRIWLGTSSGLNVMDGESITQIELKSKLDTTKTRPYVRDILEDDGYIWVTTYGDGIFRINKDGTYVQVTIEDGLFDNIVSHIVEDDFGFFWMGTNRGIFRVNETQLHYFCDGKIDKINSYSYGIPDGMISAETNGGFTPNIIKDNNGKIYFPTIAGVAVVNTNNKIVSENPPKVFIEKLRSGTTDLPLNKPISLSYDNAYIEIQYTALNYTEPNKIQFRYQLKGLSDKWFDVGTRRSALYTKIPPGNYVFNVTASNNDGVWNTQYASFNLSVIPPFWDTTWFYTLISTLFIFVVTYTFYRRVTKLVHENELQRNFTERLFESQEQERRRIAAELHDGLGQQIMIIKNRAEIAQMEESNSDEINKQLDEILQSAVSSISDVRNISHGLRPVHLEKFGLTEALNYLCDQLQQSSSIEWSYHVMDIDNLIPKNKEIHFYRVIQEGTTNIQKHSDATEASVMISKTENEIKATIWDDGKGFNKMNFKTDGLGFLGMQERLDALGGILSIESKPNEGTVLKITIPI